MEMHIKKRKERYERRERVRNFLFAIASSLVVLILVAFLAI